MFSVIRGPQKKRSKTVLVLLVVGRKEWANSQDADYIQCHFPRDAGFRLLRWIPRFLPPVFPGIIHFYSRYALLENPWPKPIGLGRASVLTWFHGDPGGKDFKFRVLGERLGQYLPKLTYVTASCSLTAEKLRRWGVPQQKLKVVPLGVDSRYFRPPSPEERRRARKALGVPDGAFCVASFQKDGVGWNGGFEPKLEKGPDVLLEVVERLAEAHDVYMLLSGPSRGYVKAGLEARGIPYYHTFVKEHTDLLPLYHAADLYLITSREEGGPLALLESLACGLPVVSTKVGMAPDVIQHGSNGYLAEVDDVEQITHFALDIAESEDRARKFGANGRKVAVEHDWDAVVRQWIEEVYTQCL